VVETIVGTFQPARIDTLWLSAVTGAVVEIERPSQTAETSWATRVAAPARERSGGQEASEVHRPTLGLLALAQHGRHQIFQGAPVGQPHLSKVSAVVG